MTQGQLIHSTHPWAGYSRPLEITAPGSQTHPTANKAFYQPIYMPESCTMTHFTYYGDGASGNVCMALYDQAGVRLVTTGSVAHAGGTQVKRIAASYSLVSRGTYYIGFSMDNAAGANFAYGPSIQVLRLAGCFVQTAAFPLPATATFAVIDATYMPLAGIAIGTPVFS